MIAVGATLVTSVLLLSGLPLMGSPGHDLVHESFASPYPVDIQKFYTKKEVAGDAINGSPYLTVHENWVDTEISCEFCTRVEYTPGAIGMAELAFASDEVRDFSDAKKLSFYIMGGEGNEIVNFKAAGKKNLDSNGQKLSKVASYELSTDSLSLTKSWRKIELDLSETDLTGVTNPLAIQAQKGSGTDTIVFYIKAIKYENKIADNPLPTNKDSKDQ